MTPTLSIINQSTIVSEDETKAMAQAVALQVAQDFGPRWEIAPVISYVPRDKQPPPGRMWLVLLDNSDQAEALGYHDVTPEEQPMGKVFAATERKLGTLVSVAVSHEALSLLADPYLNLTVQLSDGKTFYALEVCDPVRGDHHAYDVDDVPVSNFVTKEWFNEAYVGLGAHLDRQNYLEEPLHVLPGGFVGAWTADVGWHQRHQGLPSAGVRPRVGSRLERRRTPKDEWLVSDIHTSYKAGVSPPPMGLQPVEEIVITK